MCNFTNYSCKLIFKIAQAGRHFIKVSTTIKVSFFYYAVWRVPKCIVDSKIFAGILLCILLHKTVLSIFMGLLFKTSLFHEILLSERLNRDEFFHTLTQFISFRMNYKWMMLQKKMLFLSLFLNVYITSYYKSFYRKRNGKSDYSQNYKNAGQRK